MTLQEFRDIILQADSNAGHYSSMKRPDYTVWAEYGIDYLTANNQNTEKAFNIQVDRFTKQEYDEIATKIEEVLTAKDIPFEYLIDYENDTGYIHHIFDCKGVVSWHGLIQAE